jgi:hypothetical protein
MPDRFAKNYLLNALDKDGVGGGYGTYRLGLVPPSERAREGVW